MSIANRRKQFGSRSSLVLHAALALVAIAFMFGAALPVRADPEIGLAAGGCKFKTREDGTWWQSQFGFNGNLSPSCWTVSLSDRLTPTYGWRLSWVDLGRFSSSNRATVTDGDVYDPAKGCNQQTLKNCTAQFSGRGGAYGISAGVTAGKDVGPLRLEVEGGLFVYKSWWNVSVLTDVPLDGYGHAFIYNHATGYHATPYAGSTVRYKWAFVSFRYYDNVFEQGYSNGGDVGLTQGAVKQLTAGISIPLN